MRTAAKETGWRGSPDQWIGAAYDALLESGVEGVKIQTVAEKLNLSRTSFYWFFEDREALLQALLARWRNKNTGAIVQQARAYAESIAEAVLNIYDCWFDPRLFDSKLELAVRSWSLQSAQTLAEVQDADRTRIAALTEMFARFGFNALSADVRARNIYLAQIGYISMQLDESFELRMTRAPEYVRVFCGEAPKPNEFDRFLARHGFPVTPGVAIT